jgi:hypothetical protein
MTSRFADRRARAAAVLAALLAGLGSRAARASDEVDEAAARVLFSEGRKLAADGDYAAACPKFEESFRLDPGIGTGFNLADCWEHIGRTASAWGRFLGVAAAAKALGQGEREQVARERAAALEPKLSRLTVLVPSPAPDMVVKRDAVPLGPASWGVAVPVDPGPHVVQATAPGRIPLSIDVTVGPSGDAPSVTVPALAIDPAILQAAAPPGAAITGAAAPGPPAVRPAAGRVIVAGAIGVGALATAGIFGLMFQSANDDAKALCPDNVCTQSEKIRHDDLVSDARRDRNFAYAGVAIGSAALVTAALLWWRPGVLGSSATSGRVWPTLRLAASGGGAAVAGVEARW